MMAPRRRFLGTFSIFFSLICGAARPSSLRELLLKEVPETLLPDLAILGAEVPWIETLDEEETLTVVFKTSPDAEVAPQMDVTHILALDKTTQKWREGALQHEAHGDG